MLFANIEWNRIFGQKGKQLFKEDETIERGNYDLPNKDTEQMNRGIDFSLKVIEI